MNSNADKLAVALRNLTATARTFRDVPKDEQDWTVTDDEALDAAFAALAAHDLGGVAIKAAVERAGISPELVTEVLFGNCLMAGQGQAPARQAAFKEAEILPFTEPEELARQRKALILNQR